MLVRGGLSVIVVGGVGELWQGDLDVGRRAVERLASDFAGRSDVVVEDLYYGAVAVAQRLEDLRPEALVLVGATRRGRPAGTVEVSPITSRDRDRDELQGAVSDAITGYVGTDLVVDVAATFGALPGRTTVVDVEPALTEPSTLLSSQGEEALERAIALVREQVRAIGERASGGRPVVVEG